MNTSAIRGMRPERSTPERIYQLLLRAYPKAFRAAYGREMTLIFREQVRAAGTGPGLWLDVIRDMIGSAPAAHAEGIRARWVAHPRQEQVMRPMAILALLAGAADVANALAEARAGFAVEGGAAWSFSIAAAAFAGLLLIVAGVALMRGASASRTFARVVAVLCLVVFASIGLLHPWMSVFTRLIGIGFPIVLMLFLLSPRGSGPSSLAT